jgi:putative hydrolase of the HAD superfamily
VGEEMAYKAVFFDRDGTLTYNDPKVKEQMNNLIKSWGGKPFPIIYDKMIELFEAAGEGRTPWYNDVNDEIAFFHRYYALMLKEFGLIDQLPERAAQIHQMTWLKSKAVYPEVVEVLTYFQSRGYRMGVISDTSPSLKLSLEAVGLAKYFTSFTASSLVGAEKPSPIIFNAALNAQNVTAAESLYVDDYDVEADGAREQGFTSFLIDRNNQHTGSWVIRSLKEMVEYMEHRV